MEREIPPAPVALGRSYGFRLILERGQSVSEFRRDERIFIIHWGPGGNRVESAALKVAIGGFRKIPRNQIMPLASKIPTDASVKEIILPCFLCRLHAKDCRFFSMKGNLFSSDIFMKTSRFTLGGEPKNFSVENIKYEGGDDVVIRSATEPEVNPKPYSTSQGANQNTCALNMPYLTNQEGLSHEKTLNGLYTQEGVHPIWNQSKIFTEQEVMNFTSQRFSSQSICEYPTLEGDLSSSKEQPEAKPIIGVKRSLSAFQKVQYQ
ncbi:hypothetical protein YC2023_114511 [Brassica napus]